MNNDDTNVRLRLQGEIRHMRESFRVGNTDEYTTLLDTAKKIVAGVYVVSRHMSDTDQIKGSLRGGAQEILNVVYKIPTGSKMFEIQTLNRCIDKLMSFIGLAQLDRSISDINALLLEREIVRLEKMLYLATTKGVDAKFEQSIADRSDTRQELLSIFESRDENSARREDTGKQASAIQKTNKRHKEESYKTTENIKDIQHTNQAQVDNSNTAERVGGNISETHNSNSDSKITQVHTEEQSFEKDTHAAPIKSIQNTVVHTQNGVAHSSKLESSITKTNDNLSYQRNDGLDSSEGVSKYHRGRPPVSNQQASSISQERRTAILKYIKAHGIVQIKDISDAIPSLSDKTLQRTLLDMVQDGLIRKHGDRRWSRYEVII